MNKKFRHFPKLFLVALLSLGLLTACASKKAPEDILIKTKQAIVSLNSGQFNLNASIIGEAEANKIDLEGDLSSTFVKNPADGGLDLDLSMTLKGDIKSPEKNVNLTTQFQIISQALNYYLKIDEFKTTEENLQFLTPLINLYKGKWLHLSEDFIPESIANFQRSEADKLKMKQLDDLFVQSELFKVKEDRGSEKIAGHEVYVLSLELNKEGFKDYFRQIAILNQKQISDADLLQLVAPFDQVKDFTIYVDTQTFYVYKATLESEGQTADNPSGLALKLVFEASEFDQAIKINPPASAEEFNPLALPADFGLADSTLPPAELPLPTNKAPEGVPKS